MAREFVDAEKNSIAGHPRGVRAPSCRFLFGRFDCRRSLPLHSGVTRRHRPLGAGVEILDLRHFTSADLRPLLDDEVRLWANLLCWDYSGSAEMILRYMDAKFLPGYAAVSRGRVFGYAFFVYEGNKGVIGDLFVSDGVNGANRQEVERRLLTHIIETLQQSPGIHRIEAQLLAHETGIAAQPFVHQGFSRHARLFMTLPLDTAHLEKKLSPDFEIRRWTEHDYQDRKSVV